MTLHGQAARELGVDDAIVRASDASPVGVAVAPVVAERSEEVSGPKVLADLFKVETCDLPNAEEAARESWAEALESDPGLAAEPLTAEVPDEPAHMVPGTLIAGRFRVGRLLGRGGHGFVYEAEHVVLGYPVAIKVLHAAYGHDPRRRARFRREALLGSRLRHRNVVSIHDAGELPDGSPFLVMEYVDGTDLSTVIARSRLDAAATVEVGVQLLAAVTALYERGVIHRDIKPNNVMLQRTVDGYCEVKLLDFGISKAMRAELALKTLTADDCVLGTPQYMSPEQVKGEALDVRSDLYSVGALLYECITGVPPFDAETPGGVLAKILTEQALPVREIREEVPAALAALIDRAVQKLPDDRWSNPGEMSEALRAIAQRLSLPRGADAWQSLETETPAVLGTMALELVRPRASSVPPPATPSQRPDTRTAAERPRTKSGKHAEVTERITTAGTTGRLLRVSPRQRGWLALAAAIPVAVAIGGATWLWGANGPSHADASVGTVANPTKIAAAAVLVPASNDSLVEASEPEETTAIETAPASPRGRAALDPAELERRALTAFLAGRDSEAVSVFTRATEIAPTRPSAWRGLGLAAASTGDRRTASRALRRYLALAPTAGDRAQVERRLAHLGS